MRHTSRWWPCAIFALLATVSYAQNFDHASARAADQKAKRFLESNPGVRLSSSRVIVRFRSDASPNDKEKVRQEIAGITIHKSRLVNNLVVFDSAKGASSAITTLRNNPKVEYAEFDAVVRTLSLPNDPKLVNMWALNGQNTFGISAASAWNITTGDPNFVIADIDTGVQVDHLDLAANICRNLGEVAGNGIDDDDNGYIDDVNGWNFYDDNNNPNDLHGHGTHTSGTFGAVGNNGIGITGVLWQCKILPLKFIGPDGGYNSDAIRAVEYCVMMGVKVSNNSWGGDQFDQGLKDAIQAAGNSGHIFVAAAGNSSMNSDLSPMYPAGYSCPNIISVAATESTGYLAYFSNFGPTSVDIAAPGDAIYSTYIGNTLTYMSGTSMAAPQVAGVLGLVWGYHPDWTWQQVKDRVLSRARPLATLAGKCVTGGTLDAYSALSDEPLPPTLAITAPTNNSVSTQGQPVTFTGSATDGLDGIISSNIVWTSNRQGNLGTGASLTLTSLVAGFHTVTGSVTDTRGLTASQSIAITVRNSTPVVTVTSPTSGAAFSVGKPITFTGSASDQQDGDLSNRISWTSSLQGQIGNGGSFSRDDLQAGTHTVTATVVDDGNLMASATFTVSVVPSGSTAPTVSIISPSSGTTAIAGIAVTFTGSAADDQDGSLSVNINWSSNLQGSIGTGASFMKSDLSVGTHTITAQVTDTSGLSMSATTTVVVQNPATTLPAAPSGVSISRYSGGVLIKWTDNSNNETGFEIERQYKMGKKWSDAARGEDITANTTSWIDGPGSGTWHYRVRAVNNVGTSAWSAWSNTLKVS
jgi:hypothetical protein